MHKQKFKKTTFNWYYVLAGILILSFSLFNNQKTEQVELKKITVKLDKDITNVKGRRSSIDYKFWTKEYSNQFNILKGSVTTGKHETISHLKREQEIVLYITTSDFENLSNKKEDITVIGIYSNGNPLMTKEEFYYNQELYNVRKLIFSFFIALMLILNGLAKIPKKLNYIIIGTFIGFIIIMYSFGIVIFKKNEY